MNNSNEEMIPKESGDSSHYKLKEKIHSGASADLYVAEDVLTSKIYAVKMEHAKSPPSKLEYESLVYKSLDGITGIPSVMYYGPMGDYNAMAMDMLGPSLEDLFNLCHRRFSLKSVLMIADQMIQRLEDVHEKHSIHRDIKPENLSIGIGENQKHVYLFKFSSAKRYRDPQSLQHIPIQYEKSLIGTPRYCSINTHLGVEQSRRDDLEALGYVLLYFITGMLPWQGLKAATKAQMLEKTLLKKRVTDIQTLCQDIPQEFSLYFTYVRSLKFEERPDYAYLRNIFHELFLRMGFTYDDEFDWVPIIREMKEARATASD